MDTDHALHRKSRKRPPSNELTLRVPPAYIDTVAVGGERKPLTVNK